MDNIEQDNLNWWDKYKWWIVGGIILGLIIIAVLVLVNIGEDEVIPEKIDTVTKEVYTGKVYLSKVEDIKAGEEFTVDILGDTDGANIVAAAFKLQYDPTMLEAVEIDNSRSVFTITAVKKIEEGMIEAARGKPGDSDPRDADDGFTGQGGVISSVIFKAKQAGIAELKFATAETQMVADDGKGTVMEIEIAGEKYVIE